MAQKAAKQIARRNTEKLTQLHIISLSLHSFFIIYRLIYHWRTVTSSVFAKYLLLSLPSLFIQFYFEKLSRPKYNADQVLRRAGEDLDAKGLMEYMWDITYVTWVCLALVALIGEWAWWLWSLIPLYGGYVAFTTFMGVRQGLVGASEDKDGATGVSKRQQKMEKRGQKTRYG